MDDEVVTRNGGVSRRGAVRTVGLVVGGAACATLVLAQQTRLPPPPNTARGAIDIRDFGGVCDSRTDDSPALAAAIASLAAYPKGEVTIPGESRIGSNVTIPGNIVLKIPKGGGLLPDPGKAILIDGDIDAGPYVIFFGAATAGAVRFTAQSPRREFFVEWWSPPFGGSDAVPTLNAAVKAMPDYSTLRFMTRTTMQFRQTWVIANRVGLTITAGPTGEELEPFTITEFYPGTFPTTTNSTIYLKGCGHCTIEGFKIVNSVMNKGIWIDQVGATRISTNNTVRNCRFTNAYMSNPGTWMGVAIANPSNPNNEFMHIVGNYFEGVSQQGLGLYVGSDSNNHGHIIEYNNFTDLAIGITGLWSGYKAYFNHFTGNLKDIVVGHLSYPTVIEYNGSEGSRQFYVAGAEGGESSVTIRENRLAGLGANGVAWIELRDYIGPTTIMGNDYQNYTGNNSRLYSFPWDGGGNPGTAVNLIGNNYGNAIRAGMPAANFIVRTGNNAARLRLPVNIIGEPLSAPQ